MNKDKVIIKINSRLPTTGEAINFYMLTSHTTLKKTPKEKLEADLANMLKEVRIDTPFKMKSMFPVYSLVKKPGVPEYANTIAEVNLPYCLHLPNGYEVDVNLLEKKCKAKVIFKKVWTNKAKDSSEVDLFAKDRATYFKKGTITSPVLPHKEELGWELNFTGRNVEKTKDNSGYFRYTKLQVLFNTNYKKREIEKHKLDTVQKEISERVSEIVNKILDIYRYITKEEYIERLGSLNINNVYFFELDIGFYPVGMRIEGATMNKSENYIKKIKDMLVNDESPPLYKLLLLNSKSSLNKKMFTFSVVSSSQALEIFLENFLIEKYREIGFSEEETNDKLNQSWRTKDRLKVLLKETINHSLLEERILWDKWCNMYDKVRNEVIHRGKEPTPKETKDALELNKKVIKWIHKKVK